MLATFWYYAPYFEISFLDYYASPESAKQTQYDKPGYFSIQYAEHDNAVY